MSNKSGTSPQAITLPTGGGALSGIGEAFTADPFTGAGTVTVPIEAPAGRNGFGPQLSLTYRSTDGNGPFGLGWTVPMASVRRKTSDGVPRYGDGDTFVFGGEDLVAVSETRYAPRTEEQFARIERASKHWRVSSRDGLVSTYGAVIADGAKIFAWHLTETKDPFGNRIVYDYRRDGTQLYLERVRYLDFEQGRFLVSVTFGYEDRPDPLTDHRAGFEIRTRLRCRRIEVRTHAGADLLTRTYRLDYVAAANGTSLLARVTVFGHDGEQTEQLPPLDFGYSRFSPQRQRFQSVEANGALPPVSLADPDLETVDLFGNGLPDIVQMNGSARFWRNLGGARYDRPQEMDEVPAGVRLRDPGVRFADMNGDGRADLLTLQGQGYFPLAFGGRWSERGFVGYPTAPAVSFGDDDIRLIDLTGDGVVDALRTAERFELFFNDRRRGWERVETRPRRPPAEFPDVDFSDPRVKLADLTGDGLTDIVLVEQGRVDYWPYLGHGAWGRRVTMAASPVFGDEFDPRRVLLGDLDGDGLADIVYVQADRITCWINRGGASFGAPLRVRGTPPFTDIDGVRLTDLMGTGMDGVLWTSDPVPGTGSHYRFLDLTGGSKPYLLDRMDNNLGAVTTLRYGSSTSHYLADQTRPATRWTTPLPFPVHVVEQVAVTDQITGNRLTTEYRYHHGYWDGEEREFRGFGRVERTDAERLGGAPPLLTKTWFHLGPIGDEVDGRGEADLSGEYWPDDPSVLDRPERTPGGADALRTLRGRVLRTELYALDGTPRADRPYTVTELQYGIRDAHPGVFFGHLVAERTTQWERGTDPMHRFTFTDDYDAYGLPRRQVSLAVPRGRDFRVPAPAGQPYLGQHTRTSYAQRDDEVYLVDRVAASTTHEIVNDGRPALFDVLAAARLEVVGQTLNYYDGDAFVGLPLGRVGEHGALLRSETLVLTEERLRELDIALPESAGYTFSSGGDGRVRGYFVTTSRQRYDARGLVIATRDAFGRETIVAYDRFGALPVRIVNPAGLGRQAVHDYRVLQPRQVTDENGNRTAVAFTPLGLVERMAVIGKDGERVGDTLQVPGSRLMYDFLAFVNDQRPISVRTIRRVHHVNDTNVPASQRDETIETVEYSDGFGRLIQTRAQADDRDVVVNGWQVYDNKGRVIERYEPFFADGFGYVTPGEADLGQRVRMFYDPRGQVVRTVYPDDSEQLVVFGVPSDLADPSRFTATPWESYTYDANNNAGRTHPDAARGYAHHWNTPKSILIDALGRTVVSVERYRADSSSPIEEFHTRSTYDIRGNLLGVTDALGRAAFRYSYDLGDRPLRIDSVDAGVRTTVLDVAGNEIEYRDSKGALVLREFDLLNRLVRMWARDQDASPMTLREQVFYGDGGSPNQPPTERAAAREANRLGAMHRHFDEAGLLTHLRYDFTGNVLEKSRQVIADAAIVPGFRVDWHGPDTPGLLDPTEYQTSAAYDALGRVRGMRYPRDADGRRKELLPSYDRAGALTQVSLDDQVVVERIRYNAAGQRTLAALGNGVVTSYAYDPYTFRLTRQRSERANLVLQDSAYEHDLAGNILAIVDRTPGSGVAANPDARIADPELRALVADGNALLRRFGYDSLYRLVSASGRECTTSALPAPWSDGERCGTPNQHNAPQLTTAYHETYRYDQIGNLTSLRHAGSETSVRRYATEPGTNRLRALTVGTTTFAYTHDANGNTTSETTSRHFEWDHGDRLVDFHTQAGSSEPSVRVQYLYDAGGQRVKKLVRKQGGGVAVTTYIDGVFEHHRWHGGENTQLHVVDDQQRIAMIRIGPSHPNDRGPAVRYQCNDHLRTSSVVVDDSGGFVNREEHTPFGETSFGGFAHKRYRFTGKERDEESGLYYHGARYYAPWLTRWISPDPAGATDGPALYRYGRDNPLTLTDPSGTQTHPEVGPFPLSEASADDAGPYWTPSYGGTVRDLQGDYWYFPSGSRSPTHVLGEDSEWVPYLAGEVIELGARDGGEESFLGWLAGKAGEGVSFVVTGAVETVFGGSELNGADRQTYTEQAINVAAGKIVGKLVGGAGNRIVSWWKGSAAKANNALTQSVDDAIEDAFRGADDGASALSSEYYYRSPVSATEAGHALETMIPTSRWGRPGLQPGDWLMKGPPNRTNYVLSFKWERHGLNEPAPFHLGEGYLVPPEHVRWPPGWGFDRFIKGLYGQKKYLPDIPKTGKK